jgi:hypothetical protein
MRLLTMEHLRREGLRWLAVLAIALIGAAAVPPSPARAAPPLKLTGDVQDRLMALAPLHGPGIDRSLFDGRPILVTFFASW